MVVGYHHFRKPPYLYAVCNVATISSQNMNFDFFKKSPHNFKKITTHGMLRSGRWNQIMATMIYTMIYVYIHMYINVYIYIYNHRSGTTTKSWGWNPQGCNIWFLGTHSNLASLQHPLFVTSSRFYRCFLTASNACWASGVLGWWWGKISRFFSKRMMKTVPIPSIYGIFT